MFIDHQHDGDQYDGAIDLPELMARVEYDHDLLQEVFEIFTEEFPRLQEKLRESVTLGDWTQVQVAAHSLKGMLSSLSFPKASASAMRIERMATEHRPEEIWAECALLEQNAVQAQTALGSMCREAVR